jgi:hypothetical protein
LSIQERKRNEIAMCLVPPFMWNPNNSVGLQPWIEKPVKNCHVSEPVSPVFDKLGGDFFENLKKNEIKNSKKIEAISRFLIKTEFKKSK